MALGWALLFFIAAIFAAIFGFGGVIESIAFGARLAFFMFLVGFIVALLASLITPGRKR